MSAVPPNIEDAALRTSATGGDRLLYLEPQQVFDLLPPATRDAIDLDHFKDVLSTVHLMFVELELRKVERAALAHETRIQRVGREDSA
jgi:hypothetical protein